MSTPAASARPRGPLPRLLLDEAGRPRTGPLLGAIALGVLLLFLGTFAGLLSAGAGDPDALAWWALGAFLLVKVPLLAVVWWILSRRREPSAAGAWSAAECAEILAYLESQARDAAGRPDAARRLSYFAREARFVADAASEADRPAALAAAARIEALAGAAGPSPHADGPGR